MDGGSLGEISGSDAPGFLAIIDKNADPLAFGPREDTAVADDEIQVMILIPIHQHGVGFKGLPWLI